MKIKEKNMIIGIIIGILIWQLFSCITYVIFDNSSENIISGGIFSIIAWIITKIAIIIHRKMKKKKLN